MISKINDIAGTIKKMTSNFVPETAIILGSGLSGYSKRVKADYTLNYSQIESFPRTSVKGHNGELIFYRNKGKNYVIMSGRLHYYEGYSMADVVLPIRVLKMLGVKNLIVTNAAGGVNENFDKGDIMLIKDHISLFCPNPLIGENYDELGVRFPDMSQPYDLDFIQLAKASSKKIGLPLKEGVYCYLTGPSYETASDVRAVRALGADSVGMSTVPEVTAARHAGIKVCGFSYIANKGVGMTNEKLTHEDVMLAFKKSEQKFYELLDLMTEGITK